MYELYVPEVPSVCTPAILKVAFVPSVSSQHLALNLFHRVM